ncbi:hypothetical protein KAU37_08960 [Candidatus Bipolaricaulota bacterium]|nr:hypothetical protein [Candidatus Bipolaricaulota bacterium]
MFNSRIVIVLSVAALVLGIGLCAVGQETETLRDAATSAGELALTYIDSTATYIGQGIVYILNLITGDRISHDLEKPVGYLGLITGILLLFALLDAARKIIWIGIIVGWALLIVRIVLDALRV